MPKKKQKMKKIHLFLFSLMVISLTSCYDESNEFSQNYFTNEKISNALKGCLKVSKDTAVAHLNIEEGFLISEYQITFPTELGFIADTFALYNNMNIIDSLNIKMNITAEIVGNEITRSFNEKINALTFSHPREIVKGKHTAATNYFQLHSASSLLTILQKEVELKMKTNLGTQTWNNLLIKFRDYSSVPITFDIYQYISKKILEATFIEMEKEEKKIRTLPEHRVTADLQEVFGN